MKLGTSIVLLALQTLTTKGLNMVERQPSSDNAQFNGTTAIQGHGDLHVRFREVPPEICEMHPGVKSYAGYVDISDDEHMFFWFFEARLPDPHLAPLTTWISGGPGDSSVSELFTEHGPRRIDRDGKTVHYNPFSWNNFSNMLYIDQPVQVGFSYSELVRAYFDSESEEIIELADDEQCPDDAEICGNFSRPDLDTTTNSTPAAAPSFWLTLQAFMSAFPEYCNHGFHIASESYGGHYVPVFSKYIEDQNAKNIPGANHIDLRSIMIGNGWFSAQLQVPSLYEFAFDGGETYDLKKLKNSTKTQVRHAMYGEHGALHRLKECTDSASNEVCRSAADFWGANIEAPFLDESGRNNNDVRELDPSPFPNGFYIDYLQLTNVRDAIGARQTFIQLNPTVGAAFDSTGDDSQDFRTPGILRELVEKGVQVTLYAGDADYECNWLGVEAVAEAIGATGFDEAGYTDISTYDCVTHGQIKQSGLFSFVRVYEAGHAVGSFQPLLLQTLFERNLAGVNLATATSSADAQYRTQGPQKSTYWEGNATVQDHVWPENSTYDEITNLPTLKNYQPTSAWNGICVLK